MAIGLECCVRRDKEGVTLTLPAAQAAKAYMLLDALLTGGLRIFRLGGELGCCVGEADTLSGEGMTLCARTVEAIKAMLLRVTLCPQEALWLHADVPTASGDVVIRFK